MVWGVFTRPYRRCCICSANYCKFVLIRLLFWLIDVIALFLVMWPLSWYQFYVLFCFCKSWLFSLFCTACRQPVMLSLCSVTTRSVQLCVATTVSYTTQRRKCCLPPVPPLSPATLDTTFCLSKPLPHLPFLSPQLIACLSRLGIARNVPRKPRRSRRGGKNERRKIKVIAGFHVRLPSGPSSSSTPSPARRAWLLPFEFSSPPSLSPVSTQQRCRTTCLSTQWPWRPLSLLIQRSAASPSQTSQTAASRSSWPVSWKHTPCLPL